MPIDRAVVAQAKLFEDHARHEQVLHAFFDLMREMLARVLPAIVFDETARLFVQMLHRSDWSTMLFK